MNLADHLIGARLREGRGDRVAVVTEDGTFSYADVADRAGRVAAALVARGVAPGDHVLLLLCDGIDFVSALFGTLAAGAVGVMANPELPVADHEALLTYTKARAIIGEPAALRALGERSALPPVALPAGRELAHAVAALAPLPPRQVADDHPALLLLTSGSTGRPRGAIHGHRDFAHHAACYAHAVLGMRHDDVTFAVPRLHFPYATGNALLFPFSVGARTVLVRERPSPARVFDVLVQHRPTILVTVPTMTAKLLDLPQRPSTLPALRLALSAGEALPPDLFARWRSAFGVEMLDGIGSAEMFHVYVTNRPGDARPGTLGRPVPGYEAKIVRDDGSEAAPGEVGTLWVRGGSAARAYHDDPERTRAVFREDGWVVSGDFFRRDEAGLFFYEGRADDMLKVAGLYVSPLEVERAVAAHPAVEECAVVGAADEHGLIKPRAFVVLRDGARAVHAELDQWARGRLAAYKVPRDWRFVSALPRNDRGKLVRRALRDG